MKYLIRFIIILLFFLSCKSKIKQENNKITIKKELIETYELLFQPSFDPDLELKFDIYSDSIVKFSLKQNADINVFDSLHKIDYQTYEYISFGDYNKIIPLIKPNFLFDRTLTICEFNKFLTQLRIIDSSCVKHKQGELWFGCDGMPIKYSYTKGKITKEGEFWSPSPKSEQGKAFVTILEILEKDTNQIVVRTVEKIKQYIDGEKWIFKIISKNPLYIKILESPCCPCISKIDEFVQTLPNSKEVYLDVTNFEYDSKIKKDVSCLEQGFKKKYGHLRWIINKNEWDKFDELIYGKK